MKSSPQDALRSARLVLDAELAAGRIDQSVLHQRLTTHRSAWTRSPSRLTRVAQRLKMNTRRFDGVDALMGAALSFRGKVLDGGGASGPPRFLVRADEFPVASESAISDSSIVRHFHGIMTSKNVPYLMALVPSPAKSYLDPQATGERNLECRRAQTPAADGCRRCLLCAARNDPSHAFRRPATALRALGLARCRSALRSPGRPSQAHWSRRRFSRSWSHRSTASIRRSGARWHRNTE